MRPTGTKTPSLFHEHKIGAITATAIALHVDLHRDIHYVMDSESPTGFIMFETSGRLALPDFIVIGASRSGTTWLYHALLHHRQVWVPPIKELHFFDSIDRVNRTSDRAVHKRIYRLKTLAWQRAKHYAMYPVSVFSESLRKKVRIDLDWDLRFLSVTAQLSGIIRCFSVRTTMD
jgi:hypothetical protein